MTQAITEQIVSTQLDKLAALRDAIARVIVGQRDVVEQLLIGLIAGGPPQTSHELNGWGDNIVHEYLKAIERRSRIAVLYSNKDYGCEWDYDWRNKRFLREDNTKFAVNIAVYVMT